VEYNVQVSEDPALFGGNVINLTVLKAWLRTRTNPASQVSHPWASTLEPSEFRV
jgi:hypothetical protein